MKKKKNKSCIRYERDSIKCILYSNNTTDKKLFRNTKKLLENMQEDFRSLKLTYINNDIKYNKFLKTCKVRYAKFRSSCKNCMYMY